MNSKKNSFKRVAAGALAVLTVAAYTTPVANVGGLPGSVFTADAAVGDEVAINFAGGLNNFISKISVDGGKSYENLADLGSNSAKIVVGKQITVKTTVPVDKFETAAALDATSASAFKAVTGKPDTYTLNEGYSVYSDYTDATNNTPVAPANGEYDADSVTLEGYIFKRNQVTAEDDDLTVKGNATSGYTYTFTAPDSALTVVAKTTNLTIYNGDAQVNNVTDGSALSTESGNAEEGIQWGPVLTRAAKTGVETATGNLVDLNCGQAYTAPANSTVVAYQKIYKGLATAPTVSAPMTASITVGTQKAGVIQNEPISLKADHAFEVYFWDGNTNTNVSNPVAAKYIASGNNAGMFIATFNATTTANTYAVVKAVTPTYTYSLSSDGSQLLATDSKYNTANNTAVASVTAKAEVWNKITNKYNTSADLASKSSALTNKSKVTLKFTRDDNLTTQTTGNIPGALKITRNGTEITDADLATYSALKTEIAHDGFKTNATASTITAPGKYVVTYTVYKKVVTNGVETAVPQDLTYEFEIASKDKLTAENVRVYVTPPAGITLSTVNGAALLDDAGSKYFWAKKGVNEIEIGEDSLDNKTVSVTAKLYNDENANELQNSSVTVTGSLKTSILGEVEKLNVNYNNPEYSNQAETIEIQYKVVAKKKDVIVKDLDGNAYNKNAASTINVSTSIDEIKNIEETVLDSFTLENGDKENVSFEYVTGKGAILGNEELDWHEDGLPSKVGEYSVYINYNGESVAVINLDVTEHSLHAAPTAAQTAMTYGDAFMNEETLKFVDSNNKEVSGVTVKNADIDILKLKDTALTKAELTLVSDGILYADAARFVAKNRTNSKKVYTIGSNMYVEDNTQLTGQAETDIIKGIAPLPAGNYVVTIKSKAANATVINKKGYSLSKDEFVVTVAKKQLTADMILVQPMEYNNGAAVDLNDDHLVGKDTVINKAFGNGAAINLKLAGGTTAGTKIGKYTAQIAVADGEKNFTGSVKCDWYITAKAEQENQTGLAWDDTKTTIYDNGSIHVEFNRPANTTYGGKVTRFGVLYEKNGKLEAPAFADTEAYVAAKTNNLYKKKTNPANANENIVDAAYKSLVLGSSMTYYDQTADMIAITKDEQKYGANFNVVNAETGIWARPYVVLEDGKVYYGEVRYLNLVQEATDKLNLKTAALGAANANNSIAESAVTKDFAKESASPAQLKNKAFRSAIRSGYRADEAKFYVYGSYTLAADSNVKADAIQGFGVVVDKKGVIAENDADVAKKLILGKGFIEGKAVKGNDKMEEDEFGAVITPKDAVTGVWLRSFVDFGKGLVVYTEPIYIESVSEQYTAGTPVAVVAAKANNKRPINVNIAAIPQYNGKPATLKQAGVVVDKTGSLIQKNNDGTFKTTGANPNAYVLADNANASLILENADKNNYIKGKKAVTAIDANKPEYTANVTPSTDSKDNDIPLVVRPYAVYEINGKDVTIYGAIATTAV